MSSKIRILIVDDHDEVRKGLRKLLSQEEDMKIVGESSNGREALLDATLCSPDIILMDAKMPIAGGIEATNILSENNDRCKVIMLTMFEEYVNEAIKNGARGYLLKGAGVQDLCQTIRDVYEGRIVIDERIGSRI